MHSAIEVMLEKYKCTSLNDYSNALKEILHQIALLGLWRAKFFEKAAFYGGTALRIFHNLNRFSEDLDFSLLEEDASFSLKKYNEAIITELKSFGFDVEIIQKENNKKTTIESATIHANTKQQFLSVLAPNALAKKIHFQQKIKIKMEVDVDPPLGFKTEFEDLLNPIPFSVLVYQKPDLFATKIHAILNRNWQNRLKGRDWYDFVWYVGANIPLNLKHLEIRLRNSGQWKTRAALSQEDLLILLQQKISETDFEMAKKDVVAFIKDSESLNLWSSSFFNKITEKIQFI